MPTDVRGEAEVVDLAEVRRRLRERRRRGRGGRIPDALWQLAAQAACLHGVEATASDLQLDTERLKQWMETANLGMISPGETSSASKGLSASPQFIELPPLAVGAEAECTLELAEPSGRTMRISLKGQAVTQAVQLGRVLWRGEG